MKPPPPNHRCQLHPDTMKVDVSVPVPGKHAPTLEEVCPVCEPDLKMLSEVAQLWGRPKDWPEES